MDYFQPLSPKDLQRGMYILQHRSLFKRLAWLLAILLLLIIYGILIWNVLLLVQSPSWSNISQQLKQGGSWAAYRQSSVPTELEIGPARALAKGNGTYNLVAAVNNTNLNWLVESLDYAFIVNGRALDTKQSFFNTNDKHLLLYLGYRGDATIGDVEVQVSNIRWKKLDADVPQVTWDISDIKYQEESAVSSNGNNVTLPAQVTWQAQNKSLFNFWEVDWQVALFDNDSIIGVADVKERDFRSLETRGIDATWSYSLPRATRVEVWPILNVLDKNNFKSAESIPDNRNRLKL